MVKKYLPVVLLGIFFAFFYFYRLGVNTLVSWDEAWYASIARVIAQGGDLFRLSFNGKPFYDHPPMGYWLMAIVFRLFGTNEFTARLISALAGVGSVLAVYWLAMLWWKDWSRAMAAALILGSSAWFVVRARSGNLDILFILFYLLSIVSSYLSLKKPQYWWTISLSLGALLLTKTLVGFSAVPLVALITYPVFTKPQQRRYGWYAMGTILLIVLPWYLIQLFSYPGFVQRHFLEIGTRNRGFWSYFQIHPQLPLFYLHMGVRKWYYLWLAGLSFIAVSFSWLKKPTLVLVLWNMIVLYPFLTTDQTQIWHLIPVYVPLALVTALGWSQILEFGQWLFKLTFDRWLAFTQVLTQVWVRQMALLLGIGFVATMQIRTIYAEVIPQAKYIPDDVAVSTQASHYSKPIYLDDDYFPIAVYYSQQNVQPLSYLPDLAKRNLIGFMKNTKGNNFVVIVRNFALDGLKQNKLPFVVLYRNDSFSIITRKP